MSSSFNTQIYRYIYIYIYTYFLVPTVFLPLLLLILLLLLQQSHHLPILAPDARMGSTCGRVVVRLHATHIQNTWVKKGSKKHMQTTQDARRAVSVVSALQRPHQNRANIHGNPYSGLYLFNKGGTGDDLFLVEERVLKHQRLREKYEPDLCVGNVAAVSKV